MAAVGGPANLDAMINENSPVTVFDFDFSDSSRADHWLNIYRCFFSSESPKKIYTDWPGCERFDRVTLELMKFTFGKLSRNSIKTFIFNFGGAKFGFSTLRALLSNSCVPNIDAFSIENKIVFYIKRPVKAGEELTVAYL
jgi:hypothetical protein